MYGTREAAGNWEHTYAEHMSNMGFGRGNTSTCCFLHPERNIKSMVHGDDFFAVASISELEWMRDKFEEKFRIQWEVLGPKFGMQRRLPF